MTRISAGIGLVLAATILILCPQTLHAEPRPDQQKCLKNEECQVVRLTCMACCPDLIDLDAINKNFAKDFAGVGKCTPEHIQTCSAKECETDDAPPKAVCSGGKCIVVLPKAAQSTD